VEAFRAIDGLEWKKCDFHIHTPASRDDHKYQQVSPADIIKRCQELKLDAICISDHNTGDWVDPIKEAAKGTGIIIFPGVEITAQGGERNIHILAILDPSKGTANINDILSKLDITQERRGKTDVLAEGDIRNVIEVISQSKGIAILAHADSTSGVMSEMKGVSRTKIIQNERLLGVHITKDETARFLDGSDPNYKRKIATFKASDAHAIDEIGREVTYFKIGAPTISALQQCLYDPDTRIRPHIEPMGNQRILEIEFSQGFLGGQKCKFHSGLNSIVGGKGVGKSLIIDFLRFALKHISPIQDIKNDMNSKLRCQLGIGGFITVYVQVQSGTSFKITRQYDDSENPITVYDLTKDSLYEGDLHRLFPVLVYSQNEIIDISRDPSAQLVLIDNLVDVDSHNAAIADTQEKLRRNLAQYLECLAAKEGASRITQEITNKQAEIEELDKSLSDPIFDSKRKWDHHRSTMRLLNQAIEDLASGAQQFIVDHKENKLPSLSKSDKQQTDLVAYHEALLAAKSKLLDRFAADLDALRVAINNASQHKTSFEGKFTEWERTYQEFVKSAGGQKQALANKRAHAQAELDDLSQQLVTKETMANRFQSVNQQRQNLLNDLEQALSQRYQARVNIYQRLSDRSQGKLKLSIEAGADRTGYHQMVLNLAYGTGIWERTLTSISNRITPRNLVDIVIGRKISALYTQSELTYESASKLIDAIRFNESKTQELLRLPFECIPKDVPTIKYLKQDGNYSPLHELSVGQKCTALLLIALSEGTMPIIVDQPEDALDVATVYFDVVSLLRDRKEHRQFVLTTHNPNIGVSSDPDKYHILKATEAKGEIVCCGAMDIESVRTEVIDHLEGGTESYELRGKKYGLS